MTIRKLTLLVLAFGLFSTLQAQERWTLQKAIQHAETNNISIKQAEYAIEAARLTEKEARYSRYPSLSGSFSGGWQFGRTIDPTTDAFNNQTIGFNSYRLDANVPLFTGGRIHNSIRQSHTELEAAKADAETTFNFIALSLADAYLQILMAHERLESAEKRLELSRKQLEQTEKMIAAGTLAANEALNLQAQVARDEQALIQARNVLDLSYQTFKNLLELEPGTEIEIARPEIVVPSQPDPDALDFPSLYRQALNTQPQIRAGELRAQSADIGVSLAKASFFPSVVLFGSLNTNWSSAAKDFQNPDFSNAESVLQDPLPAVINGIPGDIAFFQFEGITYPDLPYLDQLDQNFGQNFGISINVPIYSRGTNRINLERAKLNTLNARVSLQQAKQQLRSDVINALTNARAAKRNYEAAQVSLEAAQAAFDNAEKRYRLGAINAYDYLLARNNLDIAQDEAIAAKYEYVFRLKVLDFYMGRELKF